MKTEFNKSLGDKIVLFFKSQIAAYTDKNGRFVAAHYDKRTKKGEVKQATENLTADMFADAPSPEPKKADKKADWTDPDIFGEASKPGKKQSDDDWPESFLKKKEIRPHEALSAAMKRGDLKAALDVIAPLSLHEAKNTVMWAGFPMRAYKSKKDMMTEMQSYFLRAAREKKDGYGLRSKATVTATSAYEAFDKLEGGLAKAESSFDLFMKSHVKQFTRKDGSIVKEHDDKRQKKVQAAPVARQSAQDEQGNGNAPAKAEESGYGHHNMQEGDSISFKAGDFAGSGKVKSVGQDGATVTDQSGRDHQVHWNEVTGRGGENAKGEEKPAQDEKQDGKVVGHIGPNTQNPRVKAEEISRALFDTSEIAKMPERAYQSEDFNSWEKISAKAPEALSQFTKMLKQVSEELDLEDGRIPLSFDLAQQEENKKAKEESREPKKLNEELYMNPALWNSPKGFLFIGPLKKQDRAEAKVKADYTDKETGEQDWTELKDMVRATIAVPSLLQIPKVLAEMKKAGIEMVQKPKNNLTGEGLHGSGYRDLNMIVKLPNGMLAELQVHCMPMTEAKEHGHEYYAANAKIERKYPKGAKDRANFSEEDGKEWDKNAKTMKDMYDKAWDKAIGGGVPESDDENSPETLHKSLKKPMMIILKRRLK